MAKELTNVDNTITNNEFPNGVMRDNDGSGNGTPVIADVYSDVQQFFSKIMRMSDISYNESFDSEVNGHQLIEALVNVITKRINSNFIVKTQPVVKQWSGSTYGNGLFVVCSFSASNTDAFMYSVDGNTWVSVDGPSGSAEYRDVQYGNGVFVAIGTSGLISRSTDGITWTSVTPLNANDNYVSVHYGNGLFVAVDAGGTSNIITSTDGITWVARTAAFAPGSSFSIYGEGLHVLVGGNGIQTSPDGITWTSRTDPVGATWRGIGYGKDKNGNGLFIAATNGASNQLITSSDGITWVAQSLTSTSFWGPVVYGNGKWVLVSYSDTDQNYAVSYDGFNWDEKEVGFNIGIDDVVYGNGVFIGTAGIGSNRIVKTL